MATPTKQSEKRTASRSAAPILSAHNLRKTYQLGRVEVPVLKGASVEVKEGEWLAILGASGSGKSTLLHLLGDLDQPDVDGGEIVYHGASLRSFSRRERNRYRNQSVGFVFQFYHLLPELTVLENTLLPSLVRWRWRWLLGIVASLLGCLVGALAGAGLGGTVLGVVRPVALVFPFLEVNIDTVAAIFVVGGGVIGMTTGALGWPTLAVGVGARTRGTVIASFVCAFAVLAVGSLVGGWLNIESGLIAVTILLAGLIIGALAGAYGWPRLVNFFRLGTRTNRDNAEQLLSSFGLGHRLNHRPRELSGGERQRVAIARALMNQPAILLADEPTGNLDEKTGGEILDVLAELHRGGLTIAMVTHDRQIADRADRIVELHDGRVV